MHKMNLRYIGAQQLTRNLANCQTPDDIAELLCDLINEDLDSAKFHMDKYKDSDSVDLKELKQEIENISMLVKKLKEVNWKDNK